MRDSVQFLQSRRTEMLAGHQDIDGQGYGYRLTLHHYRLAVRRYIQVLRHHQTHVIESEEWCRGKSSAD